MMKNRLSKTILALILTVLMMPIGSFSAMATETASADLVGIAVGNLAIADFDPADTEYDFAVPYSYIPNDFETIAVPEVKAYAEDANATISITQPQSVDNGVATITVTNGSAEKTYTVNLTPAALNLANDGGMEEGSWHQYNVNGLGVAKGGLTTDAAKAGSKSFQFYLTGTWNMLKNPETGLPMDAGVTYLLKYDVMAVDSAFSVYASEKYAPTGRVCTNYYKDGSSKDGDTTSLTTSDWTQVTQTWYSANANTDPVRFGPTGVANQTMRLDEYYYAPLVVSDITYSGEKRVQIPETGSTSFTFSGALKNQIGGTHGLEGETVSYRILGDYQGVSLSGTTLTVDSTATETIVPLEISSTLSFTNGIQTKVSKIQEISIEPDRSGEVVELYDIQVGNLSIPGFNPKTSNYTMLVPYSYKANDFSAPSVPEVKVYPKNEDAKVTIEYPEAVENGRIVITVESGEYSKVYNIDLALTALNMYSDGGFETNSWVSAQRWTTALTCSLATDSPKAGASSFSYNTKGAMPYAYPSGLSLATGKRYLVTYYTREPGNNNISWYGSNVNGNYFSEKTYYNEDGSTRGGDSLGTLTSEWKRVIQTYTPNQELVGNDKVKFGPINFNAVYAVELDEMYLSALTATDIRFNGTTHTQIPASGSTSLTLDADLINQIGGTHGLESEAVTFEILGDYQGVSLSGTTLTIDSTATEGIIPVRMKSTFANDAQNGVWDVVEIDLVSALDDASISFAQDAVVNGGKVTASVLALNNAKDLTMYIALFDETESVSKLVSAYSVDACDTEDSVIKASLSVNVPNDSKTYVVKAFLWDANYNPAIKSITLR